MTLSAFEPLVRGVLSVAIPTCFVGLLGAFGIAVSLAIVDGRKRLQRLHQIPCHRCRYYTGSPYLKCPVHPCAALSEEALGCRDYAPQTQPQQAPERKTRLVKQLRDRHQQTSGTLNAVEHF